MTIPHVAAILVLSASMIAQEPGLSAPERDRIDALFAHFNSDSPGAALAVAREGVVLYAQGYGMANLEYDIPNRPSSIFHVASVSKEFTAMCIVILDGEGALSVDDEIHEYLPELADFGTPITIRHLLHHTSGIRDQWELLGMAGWRGNDVKTQQDILGLAAMQRELNFEPGSEYLYSNMGYTLLAEIVSRVAGKPMKEFARERIFQPLGMSRTHFHDDVSHIVRGRTYAYRPQGDGFGISIPDFENYGATSLFTTVEDLMLWGDNFRHKKVGGEAAIALIKTRGVLNNGEAINYAFAVQHGDHRGLRTLGHGGSDASYRAQFTMYPDQGITIAVLANVSNGNPGGLARQVAEVILEQAFEQPVASATTRGRGARGARGARGGRRGGRGRRGGARQASLSAAEIAQYSGVYHSAELGVDYTISVRDGGLYLKRWRFPDRALLGRGEDSFSAANWRLQFTRDPSAEVNGFTITSGRIRNLRFLRR
jgi:CubicO group peptidase (beta-lactamase class C family)